MVDHDIQYIQYMIYMQLYVFYDFYVENMLAIMPHPVSLKVTEKEEKPKKKEAVCVCGWVDMVMQDGVLRKCP